VRLGERTVNPLKMKCNKQTQQPRRIQMLNHYFYDALNTGANLALAVLPSAALLAQQQPSLQTCHVAMLEEPMKVAAVIEDAAKKALQKQKQESVR
jgi:hypothetical protein